MKIVILVLSLLSLSSCQMYRAAIAERSAEASDAVVESAEWTLCNAAPVGAIKRRYDTEEEKAAYNAICSGARELR